MEQELLNDVDISSCGGIEEQNLENPSTSDQAENDEEDTVLQKNYELCLIAECLKEKSAEAQNENEKDPKIEFLKRGFPELEVLKKFHEMIIADSESLYSELLDMKAKRVRMTFFENNKQYYIDYREKFFPKMMQDVEKTVEVFEELNSESSVNIDENDLIKITEELDKIKAENEELTKAEETVIKLRKENEELETEMVKIQVRNIEMEECIRETDEYALENEISIIKEKIRKVREDKSTRENGKSKQFKDPNDFPMLLDFLDRSKKQKQKRKNSSPSKPSPKRRKNKTGSYSQQDEKEHKDKHEKSKKKSSSQKSSPTQNHGESSKKVLRSHSKSPKQPEKIITTHSVGLKMTISIKSPKSSKKNEQSENLCVQADLGSSLQRTYSSRDLGRTLRRSNSTTDLVTNITPAKSPRRKFGRRYSSKENLQNQENGELSTDEILEVIQKSQTLEQENIGDENIDIVNLNLETNNTTGNKEMSPKDDSEGFKIKHIKELKKRTKSPKPAQNNEQLEDLNVQDDSRSSLQRTYASRDLGRTMRRTSSLNKLTPTVKDAKPPRNNGKKSSVDKKSQIKDVEKKTQPVPEELPTSQVVGMEQDDNNENENVEIVAMETDNNNCAGELVDVEMSNAATSGSQINLEPSVKPILSPGKLTPNANITESSQAFPTNPNVEQNLEIPENNSAQSVPQNVSMPEVVSMEQDNIGGDNIEILEMDFENSNIDVDGFFDNDEMSKSFEKLFCSSPVSSGNLEMNQSLEGFNSNTSFDFNDGTGNENADNFFSFDNNNEKKDNDDFFFGNSSFHSNEGMADDFFTT